MSINFTAGFVSSGALDADIDGQEANANNSIICYENIVEAATVAASSTLSGYPVSNIKNPSTFEWWEATADTEQTIEITTASSAINYFAIAAHNLAGGTIKLQKDVASSWVDVTPSTALTTNEPFVHVFVSETNTLWRLVINTASGVNAKLAVVYMGNILRLQRRIYVGHTPTPYGRRTDYTTGISEDGNFQGRVIKRQTLEGSFQQQNLTANHYYTDIDPFVIHAISKPFFFANRPESYPSQIGFCWATKNITPSNQLSNGMMEYSVSYGAHAPWS